MNEPARKLLRWRFAVGLLIHLALPAYVVTMGVAILVAAKPVSLLRSLHIALVAGAWFIPAYGMLIAAVALAVRAGDRRADDRRTSLAALDPQLAARHSAQRVAAAVASLEQIAANPGDAEGLRAAVVMLRDGAWRHDDKRFQSLAADLAKAAGAFAASFDAAVAGQRSEVQLLATTAVEQIAGELQRLAGEASRLDHRDAQVAARYIELRYGGTDFTGDGLD